MKKVFLSVITAALVCSLCGCGSSNSGSSSSSSSVSQSTLSAKEKTEKLLGAVEFPSMVEISADKLDIYFGIAEDEVKEYSVYICGSAAMPDEFGVFVAKDADTAAKIKTAVEKRIEAQKKTYSDYKPDEMYKIDSSFVNVNGTSVSYAICADNTKAAEILK